MKRVVVLTGSELRHTFFRKALSLFKGIQVLASYCEGAEKGLTELVAERTADPHDLQVAHVAARERSERDVFSPLVQLAPDYSKPISIAKGAINHANVVESIIALSPDLLVCYGSSLIKSSLLTRFAGRFLNVHLGLSPYYRGSGTNFWCLVNSEPECHGATFMFIDEGIDTGEIIHQIRTEMEPSDGPHQIGNRLITEMVSVYARIIVSADHLQRLAQLPNSNSHPVYRQRDFCSEAVRELQRNFSGGMIPTYLADRSHRDEAFPILSNPALR